MAQINLNWIFTKNTLIALLLITCTVLILMMTCNKPVITHPEIKLATKEVIKEVAKDSAANKKTIDSLKSRYDDIAGQAKELKEDLATAQGMVTELLNDAGEIIDTSTIQEIRQQLEVVKQANVIKDSLTNKTIRLQDSLNFNLSLQLAQKDTLYSNVRQYFNQVVQNEQIKDKYIGELNKQIKKSGQKKTGLKIVIGVLAGALIYQSAK